MNVYGVVEFDTHDRMPIRTGYLVTDFIPRFDLLMLTGRDFVAPAISRTDQIPVYRSCSVISENLGVFTAGEVYFAGTARDIFVVFFLMPFLP